MQLDANEIRGLSRLLQDALRHPGVSRPTVSNVGVDTTVIPDTAVGAFRVERFDFDSFASAVERVLSRLPARPPSAQVADRQVTSRRRRGR
jgi:hypothetical protein